MLSVNSNISSKSVQLALLHSGRSAKDAMEKLASGTRISRAADDAAGVAISGRMTSEVRGLSQAVRNASDAIALAQTAEGALSEISEILQRMRELSVQSASGTYSDGDRASMASEFDSLSTEIRRIRSTTTWAGISILDGSAGASGVLNFQIGSGASVSLSHTFGDASHYNSQQSFASPTDSFSPASSAADVSSRRAILDAQFSLISGQIQGIANGSAEIVATAPVNSSVSHTPVQVFPASSGAANKHVAPIVGSNDYAVGDTVSFAVHQAGETPVTFSFEVTKVTALGSNKITGLKLVGSDQEILQPLTPDESSWFGESERISLYTDPVAGAVSIRLTAPNVFTIEGSTQSAGADFSVSYLSQANDGTSTPEGSVSRGPLAPSYYADISTAQGASNALGVIDAQIASITSARLSASSTTAFDQVLERLDLMRDLAVQSQALTIGGLATQDSSSSSISIIDRDLDGVSSERGALGAFVNRLNHAISSLSRTATNLEASRSRIKDADFATSAAQLARAQILQQAGTEMLAQANQTPELVLSLLG